MEEIEEEKNNVLQAQAREYCQRMLLLNVNQTKQVAGEGISKETEEEISKEIKRLRTYKSRLLKQLNDAIDAVLLINSSIKYPGAVYEPPFDVWKEFMKHLGAPERIETDEQRNHIQEYYNKANDLQRQFQAEFTKDMDRFIKQIFTPERIQEFVWGMFPPDDRDEDKTYRTRIAKILLGGSASYLIMRISPNYSDLLQADLRKAIEIAHIIDKEVQGISAYKPRVVLPR